MFTEEEAKKKICPKTFAVPGVWGADGSGHREYGPWTCIASECMAWRPAIFEHQRNLDPKDRTPGVGYCGAFGKPKS